MVEISSYWRTPVLRKIFKNGLDFKLVCIKILHHCSPYLCIYIFWYFTDWWSFQMASITFISSTKIDSTKLSRNFCSRSEHVFINSVDHVIRQIKITSILSLFEQIIPLWILVLICSCIEIYAHAYQWSHLCWHFEIYKRPNHESNYISLDIQLRDLKPWRLLSSWPCLLPRLMLGISLISLRIVVNIRQSGILIIIPSGYHEEFRCWLLLWLNSYGKHCEIPNWNRGNR